MRQDFIVTVKVYLKKTETYIFPMTVSLGVRDHAFRRPHGRGDFWNCLVFSDSMVFEQ